MPKLPEFIPVTDLRQDAAAPAGTAKSDGEPLARLVDDERESATSEGDDASARLKAGSVYLASRRIQGDRFAERMASDGLALGRLRDRARELRATSRIAIEGTCGRCD